MARYHQKISFNAPQFARSIGDNRMFVVPRILAMDNPLPPWRVDAEGSVWLTSRAYKEDTRLTIPAGYAIDELPDGWSETVGSASALLRYTAKGQDVFCHLDLRQSGGFYDKAGYQPLRLFYRRLNAARRQPVLLQRGVQTATAGHS